MQIVKLIELHAWQSAFTVQGPLPNVGETQWIKYDPCTEGAHNPGQKIDTCINNSNSRQTLIYVLLEVQKKC